MLALGLARVIDYQNPAYGQVYLRRMRQVAGRPRPRQRCQCLARVGGHARDGALGGPVDGV
jgi:hypothetical protein